MYFCFHQFQCSAPQKLPDRFPQFFVCTLLRASPLKWNTFEDDVFSGSGDMFKTQEWQPSIKMLIRKFQKSNEYCLILSASPLPPIRFHPILLCSAILCLYYSFIFTLIYVISFFQIFNSNHPPQFKLFCAPKVANQNRTIVEVL